MEPLLRALAGCLALGLLLTACGPQRSAENAEGATRTVAHAMGQTRVPAHPQRVVVLDTGELDAAMALGVTPVGATNLARDMRYLGPATSKITDVGPWNRPSETAIAKLKPDLILSNKRRHAASYDRLSKIAPTVLAENIGPMWKENFALYARALGREGEGRRLLDRYEQKVQALRTKLGDPSRIQVSMVRFLPGSIRLYRQGSFIGKVLDDVGLGRPAAQRGPELDLEVSAERLADFDGDYLFYCSYGDPQKTQLTQLTSDRLWQSLRAVQSGHAFHVGDDVWMLALGVKGAIAVVDELDKRLPAS
jgi:iron complex transport system substrate-binding protein